MMLMMDVWHWREERLLRSRPTVHTNRMHPRSLPHPLRCFTYLGLVLGLVLPEGRDGAALPREDAGHRLEGAEDLVVLLRFIVCV